MKVIALNGSPRLIGNTGNILGDLLEELEREGIETEQIHLYGLNLSACNDCRSCEIRGDGRCIDEDDPLNDIVDKLRRADGVILASPCYFGSCSSQMRVFLERAGLILGTGDLGLRRKIGAAIVVNEHDGNMFVHSQLVHWMLRNGMLICNGAPLPMFTAKNSPQYLDDRQGMRGLKDLAQEMSWALSRVSEN